MMKRMCFAALLGLGLLAVAAAGLPVVSATPAPMTWPSDEEYNPCGHRFQIKTIPRLVTEDDAVEVVYSADWGYLPAPEHDSHEVVSNVIRLDAIYYVPEVSLPVMTSWGGEANVGQLPSGPYEVAVFLTSVITPIGYNIELCGTMSFVVYEQLYKVYVPVVVKPAALSPTVPRWP